MTLATESKKTVLLNKTKTYKFTKNRENSTFKNKQNTYRTNKKLLFPVCSQPTTEQNRENRKNKKKDYVRGVFEIHNAYSLRAILFEEFQKITIFNRKIIIERNIIDLSRLF